MTLVQASDLVIYEKLAKAGKGTGGVICLDRNGNIAMPFNTEGMFRGFSTSDGKEGIFIYNDEK